jgi:MFS family permease
VRRPATVGRVFGALLDRVFPARLGAPFRRLIEFAWLTSLADGLRIAAGPLLVASQTSDPFLVGLAATVQHAPWLVFSMHAGAIADRTDRRRLLLAVTAIRAVVLAALTATILLDAISVGVVLIALALLGTAQVFAATTESTLLPMVVPRDDLALGNARLQAGFVTLGQLVGPPAGAVLFAAGMAFPYVAQLVLLLAGTAVATQLVLPPAREPADRPASAMRGDIAQGLRWLAANPAVRTLVVTIATFNVTFGAAWSVLVLYAGQRLGLGEIGFGLITTVGAVGGLLGTVIYGRLVDRFSLMSLMRFGLIYETFTHLALATISSPWLAMPVFLGFGVHAIVWTTTSATLRQRLVPSQLQGRISGVNLLASYGGLAIGGLIGGALAAGFGITAPYWFAFVGSAGLVAAVWAQLRHLDHADAAPAAA